MLITRRIKDDIHKLLTLQHPSLILDLNWSGYHLKKKVILRHIKTVLVESDYQSKILKKTMVPKGQEEQRESSEPTQSLQKMSRPFSFMSPATKGSPPKMHPLKHLAREMLGCTTTSAPPERVFSVAGNFSPNRPQLGVATFRELLLIKSSKDIYDQLQCL
ncbi:hypothetical protein Hamer_G012351 [Homarus americanus]|uniref:HAT C-terminal dimerisation domain-containing protein n=1 Tax=Homarus americanus TaxID=6706 RepID=A0A8J5K578_HOMAM|nr:hypothetical protein Hamer_G012351 [Homarus americanus]